MKNKLLKANQNKIQSFAKLLRKRLLDDGCHKTYVNSLSEQQILNDFRICADCEVEICTKDQQMQCILEFDTPQRAFDAIYDNMEHDSSEEKEAMVTFDDEEVEDLGDLEVVRGKWILEGSRTIDECLVSLRVFKEHLEELRDNGYELIQPVEDDYGCLKKNDET